MTSAVVVSVYGLASTGSGFGGMVFAVLTGWIVDRWSYVPVCNGFGLMPLICAGILWTLLGPLNPGAAEARLEEAYVQ
jgi:MFS transporter, ACS family, hexuronate transporter